MGHVTDQDPPPPTGEFSDSDFMNLTAQEKGTLQTVERVGASLSLVGVCLIFITFALFKRLRTVPNTFILFASISNVGASVACLIGFRGLNAGESSALCQIQGFLLEMFMQSDPWWSLAMAVNVYMVFFLAANPVSFRKYLWVYCIICFGVPALPAVILLVLRPSKNGQIYGNATDLNEEGSMFADESGMQKLWCWIGDAYNPLRIFTYYIPIWVCILLSTIIYIAVGYHVFHQRNQLRNLTLSNQAENMSCADGRESDQGTTYDGQPGCYGMVTTEVRVTAEAASDTHTTPPGTPTPSIARVLPSRPSTHQSDNHHPWAFPRALFTSQYLDDDPDTDLVLHDVGGLCSLSTAPPSCRLTRSITRSDTTTRPVTAAAMPSPAFTTVSTVSSTHRVRKKDPSRGALPSSNNIVTRLCSGTSYFFAKLRNLDPVKLAYLRTSFVFAISILITWAPSSINRVYTLIHPHSNNFGLNIASAVVLPLQGVWNCVIYCATSWYVLVDEVRDLWDGLRYGRWERGGPYAARSREESRRERKLGRRLETGPSRSNMRVIRGSF